MVGRVADWFCESAGFQLGYFGHLLVLLSLFVGEKLKMFYKTSVD